MLFRNNGVRVGTKSSCPVRIRRERLYLTGADDRVMVYRRIAGQSEAIQLDSLVGEWVLIGKHIPIRWQAEIAESLELFEDNTGRGTFRIIPPLSFVWNRENGRFTIDSQIAFSIHDYILSGSFLVVVYDWDEDAFAMFARK